MPSNKKTTILNISGQNSLSSQKPMMLGSSNCVELEEEDEVSIEHKDSTVMNMKLGNGFNNNTTNSRYQTKKELSLNSVGSSSNNQVDSLKNQDDMLKTGSVKGLSQLFTGGVVGAGKEYKSNFKGDLQHIDEQDSSVK